jgi:subtilisin family serine protease
MGIMRAIRVPLLAGALAAAAFGVVNSATADDTAREYIVVYQQGVSAAQGRAAVKDAGATIVRENAEIGVATVRTTKSDFTARAARQSALVGAAANDPVGRKPDVRRARAQDIERLDQERKRSKGHGPGAPPGHAKQAEPLAGLQWDMKAIDATIDGSYAEQQGSKKVLVGVLDTGIDGSHPDIKPNFDSKLSRNFTTDVPIIDGACASDPDGSCSDPADVDEDGHGTHVAGTIAAPINGLGMAGVAPRATLVNLRAGQDSGYFFLQPTVDALTFAGDHGIDVVNMSYYIDPWLYNCTANPADSPAEQAEQRTVIAATQRALDYARNRGVTLIAAEGNGHTDLGKPKTDTTSPDFPPGNERTRTIDNNTCKSMPTEADGVIGVTSVGPSGRKAYYSDYGVEQADVAAPGGDYYDGTPGPQNTILAPYPESLAQANGDLNEDGTPNTPFVVRDCKGDRCAYYQYLQGTSMASPHAVGVAALAVSEYGRNARGGGLTLDPAITERALREGAVDKACPAQEPYVYPPPVTPTYTATCEGPPQKNGFFGDGVVNALRTVQVLR